MPSPLSILLINPPRSPANAILDHAPENVKRFIHKKLIGPPLGLLTVASAVKHHHVHFLDMKGEYDLHADAPDIEKLTEQWLKSSSPRIVGVTCISSEYDYGLRILRAVKRFDPGILTVAGGLHATLCPEDFRDPAVDIVAPGQAALTFRDIADALANGQDPMSAAGIAANRDNRLCPTSPLRPIDAAGDDFIMPDRNLIKPWMSTYYAGNGDGPVTYLFTSLGCPCRCSFCSIWPQFAGKFYQRSIDSLMDELNTLEQYPVVRFADANTIVNTLFIDELFDRIIADGIRKSYIMDIRFDTIVKNPSLIKKLARAGLKVVICGFESFRQKELDEYGKSASAGAIRQAVDILNDNGIQVRGNFVVDPRYSEKDFDALAAFASQYPTAYAGYTILTPMPGTVLHGKLTHSIVDRDLSRYNFFNCVLRTTLPVEDFYRRVASLWMIRKGKDVI